MDKETKALIDFYKNQIKDKQDKLDKLEEYIKNNMYEEYAYVNTETKLLQIIKGEDK